MKINEKNLCAYSISPSQIDKEGYLQKKGEVNKSFQRRWFVLKGNLLFYFEKKGDREPIGVIILEGCTIELAECEDQFTFKLLFHGGGGRTYVLAADSQESLEAWMKALARASYDYLKLMVAELQKQLDELNDAEKQGKGGDDNNMHPPKAPQRQRQNPFNRTQSSNEVTLDPSLAMRMRANTVSGGGGHYLTPTTVPQRPAPPPPSVAHITFNKRTFAQLHSEYGVAILRDKELGRTKRGKHDSKGKWENLENVIPSCENQPADAASTENAVVMDLISI
ncbi:sesquipedalian-1-like [Homarus americanus]|uniref:Sesquipedalian-1-like n=1 Tax=Homarus americanus TaxID=6706 RepID=A0A8J5NHH4_HOMAM|nr:sesquipedalian-1-like [Homarus americanus]KAG7178001.1 Sesquipedalian-1-like [Homarus americanus]